MSLKSVRMIQRIVGVLLLVYGIYLIFVTQEFFGTLLIIIAFLIFPSLSKEKARSSSDNLNNHVYYNDSANDHIHVGNGESSDDYDDSGGSGEEEGGNSDGGGDSGESTGGGGDAD
ncbi:hypothetical protein FAY30_21100 [Bacillus sp. S3]|uniref:hypothetical protein n=1 Tax=Bacillus sp. S3 TaxID=486398 RepID=UPI001188B6F8|nr:hypothetical protein [Bacillus sp. S3]QCJ44201.1 hypothetical protein FAY30_21100 [Bacillus sp. S3]